jgi:hypothetical protein
MNHKEFSLRSRTIIERKEWFSLALLIFGLSASYKGEKFQVLDNRIQELSLLLLQKCCYTPDSGHLSLIMKNIFFTFFSGLTIRQASLNGLVLGA